CRANGRFEDRLDVGPVGAMEVAQQRAPRTVRRGGRQARRRGLDVADPALYVEVLRADTDESLHGQAFDVAGRQLTPRKPLAKHLADDVETPTLPEGVAVILVWHAAGGNQEANDLLARLGAQGGELATDQSPQVGPRRVHRGGID